MKYAYSTDRERYEGEFDSAEEAAREAFAEDEQREQVEVSVIELPLPPEHYVNAGCILEHILCQDDYNYPAAEDWPGETKEQRDELTEMLQKTVAQWLDKHSLRPTHFMCNQPVTYYREEMEPQ